MICEMKLGRCWLKCRPLVGHNGLEVCVFFFSDLACLLSRALEWTRRLLVLEVLISFFVRSLHYPTMACQYISVPYGSDRGKSVISKTDPRWVQPTLGQSSVGAPTTSAPSALA